MLGLIGSRNVLSDLPSYCKVTNSIWHFLLSPPQLKHSVANLINTSHWRNTQLNLKFSCDGISALFHGKLCKWLVIMSVKKIKLCYESELVWLSLPVSNFCSAFSRVRILSGMRNIISVCGPISVWPSTQK